MPESIEFTGFGAGESPAVVMRYRIEGNEDALAEMFGSAFAEAKAASTDGTVTVVIE